MEQQQPTLRRRCDRYAQQPAEEASVSLQKPVQQPSQAQPVRTQPQQAPLQSAYHRPVQTNQPVRHTQPQQSTWAQQPVSRVQHMPPAGIERHAPAKKSLQSPGQPQNGRAPRKKEWQPSAMLKAGIVVCMLLCLACAAARVLMNAWLKQQYDAREQAHQRLIANHPIQYEALIEQYAAEYNLQPAFVAAIILNESSFNSHAESGVGARGLMQLMPDTGEWIAHKLGMDSVWTPDLLWEPEVNIRFGCWYLNYLSGLFGGDPVTVASAYHTGQGQVKTWLTNETYAPDGHALSLEGMPDGPTKTYAGRVTRDYGIYDKLRYHVYNPEEPEAQ